MREKILVVGSGGHARVVIDIIESSTNFDIIGIISKDDESKEFLGYQILGNDDVLDDYKKKGITNLAIGVGGYRNNTLRKALYKKIKSNGFRPATLIHKSAVISRGVAIGEGTVVFPGVIINTDVKIGNNVIIATSTSIDHETIVEDHVLISAGVTIGAYTSIHQGALIALGAKIISGIKIGNNVLIGAGSVVVKDAIKQGVYLGSPARKIK